jgi:glycosyltransferase
MRILKRFAVELCYVPDVLIKMQLGGMSNRSLKHILVKSKEDWRAIRHNRIGHVYTLLGKNLGKVGQLKLFRRLLPNIDN